MLNKEQLKKDLQKRLDWHIKADQVSQAIKEIAIPMIEKGNTLNKRLETKLRESEGLKDYSIYMNYEKVLEWFTLEIWGNGIDYNEKFHYIFRNWEELKHEIWKFSEDNHTGMNFERYTKELENLDNMISDYEKLQDNVKNFKNKYGVEEFNNFNVSYTLQKHMPLLSYKNSL